MTLLNSVGADGRLDNQDPTRSVLSAVGRAITPAFRPMGVTDENWPATVGLFMGIFSKESVIGVLDSLYTQLDAPRGGEGCPTAGCAFNLWKALRDAFDAIPEGFGDLWRSLIAPFGGKPQDHARPASIAHDEPLLRSLTRHFPSRTAAVAYLLFVLIYTPCAATIVAIGREANWRWAAFSVCYQTLLAWVVSTSFYQVCVWPERPASSALWLVFCCAACTCVVLGLKAVARRLPEGS
jgi:ferrous iron transport protein B